MKRLKRQVWGLVGDMVNDWARRFPEPTPPVCTHDGKCPVHTGAHQ